MEMKPGYKETVIEVLPEGWHLKKLDEIAELTSSKRIFEHEYSPLGIPFYRGKEISLLVNGEQISDGYFISESRYHQIKNEFGVPSKGDILITAVGTLGNVYVVPDESEFYFKDGNLIWLKDIRNADSYYLAEQIRKKRSEIVSNAIGSSQKALTIVVLKGIRVALPPLEEQETIAAVLSDVDALITILDRLITKKRAIKQGAMQQLLTGNTRLPGFRGRWAQVSLGEIGEFSKGTGLSKEVLKENGTIPAIPYTAIYTDFDEVVNHELIRNFTSSPETVIIDSPYLLIAGSSNMLENIGKATAFNSYDEVAIGGDIILYKTDADVRFLSYLLSTPPHRRKVVSLSQGSTIRHVYASTFMNYEIALPELEEQHAIIAVLADMDADIDALEQQLDKTRALKQGMMQELLTGKTRLK